MEPVQPISRARTLRVTCKGHVMIEITSPAPLRVLVVDACADMTDSLAMLLNMWGCDARTANDGPAALESARAFCPEVLLMDIELRGPMNGFGVARKLRAGPNRPHALLVCITRYDKTADRRKLQQAGFERHFLKPANLSELRLLLKDRMASRRSARQSDNRFALTPRVDRQVVASAM